MFFLKFDAVRMVPASCVNHSVFGTKILCNPVVN